MKKFTIFIPTYNRKHTLPRAFASIEKQTYKDFDVVIVDDGSTDGTESLVNEWKNVVPFSVFYYFKENGGKPSAYNYALDKITGYFTILLDSDDELAGDALEKILYFWEKILPDNRDEFAGVEGLTALIGSGKLFSPLFKEDIVEGTYLEISGKMGGERKNAIRTEVMKKYPFPVFENEKDMRESVIWSRMSHEYKIIYVNHIFQYIDFHSPDGLSVKPLERRIHSPNSFMLSFYEDIDIHNKFFDKKYLIFANKKYIRYGLHAGYNLRSLYEKLQNKDNFIISIPYAVFRYYYDKIRHYQLGSLRKIKKKLFFCKIFDRS